MVVSYPVGPKGVSIAHWNNGQPHEWAFWVDPSGKHLRELRYDAAAAPVLYAYDPPSKHSFTGHVEARTVSLTLRGTTRDWVFVAATTVDSVGGVHLLTCARIPPSATCNWVDHGKGIDPDSDIISTTWPSVQSIYFFVTAKIGYWSLGASTVEPGTYYLAFQADEPGAGELHDIYLAYSRDDGMSWNLAAGGGPVAGAVGVNDVYPQVVVSGHDTVAIGWYEQRDCSVFEPDQCVIGNVLVSVDSGTSWSPTLGMPSGDLCDIPRPCGALQDIRFVGDYRESTGSLLHTHLNFTLPVPLPTGAEVWNHFIAPRWH